MIIYEIFPIFLGKKEKRGLVALADGSIVDEALLSPSISSEDNNEDAAFQQSLKNGLAGFERNVPVQNEQKEKVHTCKNFT